ncbi:hypothetical protein KZX45_02415 [Georgenia sp. EYE_87]|nr:hypothetical protein [Georgenia sp. EYE_87]MCK6209395.1 hypothetical protein [Georgenia sp. EYE_87]
MRLRCRVGIHSWQLRNEPAVPGRAARYAQCRRCGKERREYTPLGTRWV